MLHNLTVTRERTTLILVNPEILGGGWIDICKKNCHNIRRPEITINKIMQGVRDRCGQDFKGAIVFDHLTSKVRYIEGEDWGNIRRVLADIGVISLAG
jgi:hypothetical protein